MRPAGKQASKVRIFITWFLMVGFIVGITAIAIWGTRNRNVQIEAAPDLFRAFITLIIGAFGFLAGIALYVITVAGNGFTFDFDRKVWNGLRGKLFLANIIVPLITAIGFGLMVSAILSPVLVSMGLSGSLAYFLPAMAPVALIQIVQLWVNIWAPIEQRIITKRLGALGITQEQLQSAFFVGLSDPASGTLKRMGTIETDMGALWVGPEQLVYWGDVERLAICREQLLELERRIDARSTSVLGGIAHVILCIQCPNGTRREIRLHTEGHWTMAQKRRAMDELDARIAAWHSASVMTPPL